jgi:hypothetical protein
MKRMVLTSRMLISELYQIKRLFQHETVEIMFQFHPRHSNGTERRPLSKWLSHLTAYLHKFRHDNAYFPLMTEILYLLVLFLSQTSEIL